MGNLHCYILGMEGPRKLKFGEVKSSDLSIFLRENQAKKFQPECSFKLMKFWSQADALFC